MNNTAIRKHSVVINGHKTSISLEDEFYEQVKAMAARRECKISEVVEEIEAVNAGKNLSSQIRLAVLRDMAARLAELEATPSIAPEAEAANA
jgi:predicted DNA-binding ribbon-helix-helix protein